MSVRIILIAAALGLYLPLLIGRIRKRAWMSILISILSVALAVYVGLGLMLFFFQSRILFQPSRVHDFKPEDAGLKVETVKLTAADGAELDAWHLPGGEYTVLFCHGNAGNISHRLDTLAVFQDAGLGCLLFDYRGYGRSGGKPSEKGLYLDARAGWDWLMGKGCKPANVILFGRSLGASVAAAAAAQLCREGTVPAGLVLESGFTSVPEMGKHLYPYLPVGLAVRYRFDTVEAVQQVRCPVLVIHSRSDEIVPWQFGQEIFAQANEPKELKEISGSHNEGFLQNWALYKKIWTEWVKRLKSQKSI